MIKLPYITELRADDDRILNHALVIDTADGNTFLQSYETVVASVDPHGVVHRHSDAKSRATSKHINAFLKRVTHTRHTIKWFYSLDCEC